MTFVLVMLFTLAVIITMAGFLLSVKPQFRNSQSELADVRVRRRVIDTTIDSRLPGRSRATRAVGPRLTPSRSLARTTSKTFALSSFGGSILGRGAGEEIPWKTILVGLALIFVISLYLFNLVFPRNALWATMTYLVNNTNNPSQSTSSSGPVYHASQDLVRISQLDPSQYANQQEYDTWAYSACSTASMTEVFNSYGRHYRITDVLKVESALGEITPSDGLLHDRGIARTAAQFGFKTSWGYKLSLDQIIAIGNAGRPVIVDFPPYKYSGGHLLVVLGGDSNYVHLADSSAYNRKYITRAQFLQWWAGFSAIVTPN
ncbi:MAG TPA: C39 family peptidase [Ktedonobacteraceae bacterium]|jgi:hypothetical protein|nr:C39 family peptidase [Ktedonobacteraceae bacterium]